MSPLKLGRVAVFLGLALIAASTIYPFVFMGLNSVKTEVEYARNPYGLPERFSLENLRLINENLDILASFGRSLLIVSIAVVICLLMASIAAFALAKVDFPGRRAVLAAIIALLLIPGQVLLVPIYLLFAQLGLVNNYGALIAVYVTTSLPFAVFMLTSNFRSIPTELIGAARIDGASMIRTWWSVVMPIGKPAVMTLAILTFLSMWNELILALLLIPDEARRLLTPALASIMDTYLTNQPLLMAGLLFSSLPMIVALVVFSRYLVRGVTLGFSR